MSSALSLSLWGLLLCAALSLANPLGRAEEVSEIVEVTEVTSDTDGLHTLDEMIAGDVIKQQTDIEEMAPDHEESMTNALEEHKENVDGVLGDVEEVSHEEAVEDDPSEVGHEVVKRDVEKEEKEEVEDGDEVVEDEEHIEKELENEGELDEHEEENDGLLTWYREAIETNST